MATEIWQACHKLRLPFRAAAFGHDGQPSGNSQRLDIQASRSLLNWLRNNDVDAFSANYDVRAALPLNGVIPQAAVE